MKIRLLTWVWSCCVPVLAGAEASLSAPNWDETLAIRTASAPDSRARLDELFSLLDRKKAAELGARLDRIISGTTLAAPARDFILFQFAVGLAEYEDVDPRIVERLRDVKPRVLVPHPERASLGVPLFNIAGAAEGAIRLQERRAARNEASAALGGPADDWVAAYLLASPAQRPGFTDALNEAPDGVLAKLLEAVSPRLPDAPELTPIAGKSALLLGNTEALRTVVKHGGGSQLANILEAAALTLSSADTLALLEFAVSEAPAVNASLAIAQLSSVLRTHPEANELLISNLGNADLGAAAALALAASESPQARSRLQQIAEQGDGLSSARAEAALALETPPGRRP